MHFNSYKIVMLGVFLFGSCSVSMARPIQVIPFQDNKVTTLHATTFTATEIQFGEGESIESIQNGDVAAWTIDVLKARPNTLFIKPTIVGSNTNMTVLTNRHSYYFHLISQSPSTSVSSVDSSYALKFIYPEDHLGKLASMTPARAPRQYHWKYSFHGSRTVMPLHVYDDGHFTYLQLRHYQAIPAIFAVDTPSGKEAVVNFRREGRYLVIHRLAPQWTLREGAQKVASIFNDDMIRRIRHG